MSKVKTCVLTEKTAIKPVAHFTNGKINENLSDRLSFGQFIRSGDDRKRKQTVLVGETENMSYIGKNFGPDASKAQTYCRYYIGVVDRARGKMKVFDSEIIQMVPKHPDFQEQEEKEKVTLPGDIQKTYKQKIDDLTASFGSKRKKQAMGSRLQNEIRGEALERALSSAVADAVSQVKNLKVTNENGQSSLIPPYNKDAERPEDVYSLDTIISPQEMELLTSSAQVFHDCTRNNVKEWADQEKYPQYVCNHLALLPLDTELKWKKSKMLMYLNFLIYLYKLKSADIKPVKNVLPEDWPGPIKKKLYEQFTLLVDSGGRHIRCITKRLKDKLIIHILVLSLMIDEFEMPLDDLKKDLTLGRSLETHARTLGCKVKAKKIAVGDNEHYESRIAVLETPLRFPEVLPKKVKARK